MKFTKRLTFLIATVLIAQGAMAQKFNSIKDSLLGQINTITTAVPFLLIAPDARAGGMGDYGVATSPDPNSIHWNPAKLSFATKQMGIAISYTPWLKALVNDIYLANLAGYTKLSKDQAITGSLTYFSLGNIDFTDETGNKTTSFTPHEFAVDLGYSRKLGEDFSGGLVLRYIHSNLTGGAMIAGNIQTNAGNSVAADLAGFYHKELDVAKKKSVLGVGLDISNIGSKISYSNTGTKDFIPTNFRLGTNLEMELDQYNSIGFGFDINKLLVPTNPVYYPDSIDANGNRVVQYGKDPTNVSPAEAIFTSWGDAPGGFQEELKEFIYSIGTEYWYDKQFAIRAGYFHEAATKGNRQFFTVGVGLRFNVFGLDAAYLIPTTQRNPLENTIRFTLVFNFENLKSASGDTDKTE